MNATSTQPKKTNSGSSLPMPNGLVFIIVFAVAFSIYKFVFGAPGNLDEHGHAKPGNLLGMVYMGGFIVPILLTLFISMWVFSIERFLSLRKAAGGGNVDQFLRKVNGLLASGNIAEAKDMCNKQKGSIANVTLSGLNAFEHMKSTTGLSGEQKVLGIQEEMEESIALEVPMLQKNMVILSTIATIATLGGLIGTVIGMINSFKALGAAGAPDQAALATGISEALINTAIGISTSFFAIVFYNFFSSSIDEMTYKMDEAEFIISQSFAEKA